MRGLLSHICILAVGLCVVCLSSCATLRVAQDDLVLRGYDRSNYALLDAALGERACIVGRLSVDDVGVYFLLQPYEEDGIIQPSPSRVRVDIREATIVQSRLRNGQVRRVCGLLQDATPSQRCERDYCKRYELRDPEIG